MNDLFQDPPRDFPNRLTAGSAPCSPLERRQFAWLLLLWLACFVLRAGMSFAWSFLWGDSIVYLRASAALEQGNFQAAFDTLGLNVYPAILLCLRATGWDLMVSATWWSVWMASLVVFPLFGLVRRQFNDQIAVVACALYVMHPVLLGFSPLIMRDATFWFLFTMTLYLQWRAVTELRWWLFGLAGVSLTLAAYTRTEGWLLPVPLVLWCLGRWPAAAGSRVRLAIGTCATLATVPLLVTLVNVTLLHGHSHWEWGDNQCVRFVVSRLSPPAALPADKPETDGQQAAAPANSDESLRTMFSSPVDLIGKVSSRLAKAFSYTYGILAVIGLWNWRRVFLRRDQQALLDRKSVV